ncbi:hypothetical protein [Thioalkalivibrio sp. AKL12]|uniref:hypothetical protein n=1 Tax=Thioalkalivibrio sp. AKL12 TaxID=1158159 RepID=UPI0003A26FFC|nr:hypothetical protein [Thioalkalivibrio sp. AKL12]
MIAEGLDLPFDGQGGSADLLQEALHAVRVHMNLEVAFISEIRDGCRTFRFVDEEEGAPKLHVGDSDPVELSYCQRVVAFP